MENQTDNPQQEGDAPRASSRTAVLGTIALVAIVLIGLEALVRVLIPVPEVQNFNRLQYSPTFSVGQFDSPAALRNARYTWVSDPDNAEFTHDLNLYGFRDRQWPLSTKKHRVMFLGDSFVEGVMATAEQTIPSAFGDAALADHNSLEIMNLGIAASGPNDYLRLLRDAAPLFQPDDVFVVFFFNDIPPKEPNENNRVEPLEPRYNSAWMPRLVYALQTLRDEGAVVTTLTPPKPFLYFQPVPHPSNPWTRFEKDYTYVDGDVANAMKAGRFNPFAVNSYNNNQRRMAEPPAIRGHLQQLMALSDEHDFTLHVAYIPTNHQVSTYYAQFAIKFAKPAELRDLTTPEYQQHAQQLAKLCDEVGIDFIDTTPILQEAESGGQRLYWDYDTHMRGEGYTLVGKILYDHFAGTGNGTP